MFSTLVPITCLHVSKVVKELYAKLNHDFLLGGSEYYCEGAIVEKIIFFVRI
jgi:hypothetical protein